jgi:protein-S-isoprenylcysteine O-methyltransferase Ste14
VLVALALAGPWLDATLGVGPLFPPAVRLIVGLPLAVAGALLSSWCIVVFASASGTPVPFSPPRQLVVRGPYMHTRNPMVTGLLASLLGVGLLMGSPSLVLGLTPLATIGAVAELKLVEEPELKRRLGAGYDDYRRRVPMFMPRPRRAGGRSR